MEEPIPASPEGALEYLRGVAKRTKEVAGLIQVGAPVSKLREYSEQHADVVLQEKPGEVVCRLKGHVFWQITVNEKGEIAGYLFGGFDDLIAELGIDFSGNPFAKE